jgi:hypothetical protein
MPRILALAAALAFTQVAGLSRAADEEEKKSPDTSATQPAEPAPKAQAADEGTKTPGADASPAAEAPAKEKDPDADKKILGTEAWCHTDARAGYPREISCLAQPSNTPEYFGYYVGGACVFDRKGGGPGPLQGTYGWDYGGHHWLIKPKIVLNFCYGCRYKGGIGAYETEKGPKVPNIFGVKLPEREGDHAPELGHGAAGANCAGH